PDGHQHVDARDQNHEAGEGKEDAADAGSGAGPDLEGLHGLSAADAEDGGVENAYGDEEAKRAEDVQEHRELVYRHVMNAFALELSYVRAYAASPVSRPPSLGKGAASRAGNQVGAEPDDGRRQRSKQTSKNRTLAARIRRSTRPAMR